MAIQDILPPGDHTPKPRANTKKFRFGRTSASSTTPRIRSADGTPPSIVAPRRPVIRRSPSTTPSTSPAHQPVIRRSPSGTSTSPAHQPVLRRSPSIVAPCRPVIRRSPSTTPSPSPARQPVLRRSPSGPSPSPARQPVLRRSLVRRISRSPKREIKLLEHQVEHLKTLKTMLDTNSVVLDYSEAGLGKTYIATVLALMLGFKVVVLCPNNVVTTVWTRMRTEFGAPIVNILTYAKLVGRAGADKLNHPYLIRSGQEYKSTSHLNKMVKEGVLFVFDEMAITKNKGTLARKAVHAIIKEIVKTRSSSRAINISALPNDKVEQIQSMCQVMGIVLSDKYWDYNNREGYILQGIMELIRWCKSRDPIKTLHALKFHMTSENYSNSVERGIAWTLDRTQLIQMTNTSIPMLVFKLYTTIVRDRVSSCMVRSAESDFGPPPIHNMYCEVYDKNQMNDSESMDMLQAGREILVTAVNRRSVVNPSRVAPDQGEIRRGFRIIGGSMLKTVYHMILQGLEREPNRKFVVGVWFVDHIKWLMKALEVYRPRAIYGAVNEKNREGNIRMFQKDNALCRILIINPTVGSMGISLDDQIGNRPRTMIVIPDCRFQHLVQFTYRIWRSNTVSRSETAIYLLFSPHFKKQLKILENLTNKSDVAREIINHSKIRLPSEYDSRNLSMTVDITIHLPPLPSMSGASIL
jgi:hypothetical protein